MVETSQIPRKRKVQAWYICALLHYQGKINGDELWAVGLLRRSVAIDGIKNRWEFVENLDYAAAKDLLDTVRTRLVRATPGDLQKVLLGVADEGP